MESNNQPTTNPTQKRRKRIMQLSKKPIIAAVIAAALLTACSSDGKLTDVADTTADTTAATTAETDAPTTAATEATPAPTEAPTTTEAAATTTTELVCTPPEIKLNSVTCGVPPTTVPPPTSAPCINGEVNGIGTEVCYGGVWVPKPKDYPTLDSRGWDLLVKDPDAHAFETYHVYGYVTQFDAATGDSQFRADADYRAHTDWYDYEDNVLFGVADEDAARLADVVQGDIFEANITVVGSFSYDTQIGGSTTVPLFLVDAIAVTGHDD